jgi:hypothetical protein
MLRSVLVSAVGAFLFSGCGNEGTHSSAMGHKINIENTSEWVSGDGGPIIVLQDAAVPNWAGAEDYEESLMAGGTKRTDYDVICELKDGVHVLNHKAST